MNMRGPFATIAASVAATTAGEIASPLSSIETGAYASAVRATWRAADLPPASVSARHNELIRYATLAPSNRNAQPWKFRLRAAELLIHPDFTRRMPLADPDDAQLYIALGGAAENASITARAFGLNGEVTYHPPGRGGLRVDLGAAAHIEPSALFHAIPRRQSTRGHYDERVPSARELNVLERVGTDLGVHVAIVTERHGIARVAELVRAAQTILTADAALLGELRRWVRFSEREALRKRDGLFARCAGKGQVPRWLGDPFIELWMGRDKDIGKYAQQMRSSGGFAVFFGSGNDPRHWTAVGRACERFLLHATVLNMRTATVNELIEARAARVDLGAALGGRCTLPSCVIRFGYGPPSIRSLRLPLEQVIL